MKATVRYAGLSLALLLAGRLAAQEPSAPAPSPPAAGGLARQADRSWEGMVLRTSGAALFRSRWEQGMVSFREEKLSWRDASDEARNLSLPGVEIREHFLVCPTDAESDPDCFEWGVKTATAEYRFRDASWKRSLSTKPRELFDFMQAIYPDLPAARVRAAKK